MPDRRAPRIERLGSVTIYTLPPLRVDRRGIDMAERERRAMAVMHLLARLREFINP